MTKPVVPAPVPKYAPPSRFGLSDLRTQATVQAPPDPNNLDASGHPAGYWRTVALWRCTERDLFGYATEQGGQTLNVEYHTLIGRYNAEVLPGRRLLIGDKTYYIDHVGNTNDRTEWIECMCRERVGVA